jgi:hypothetical protein
MYNVVLKHLAYQLITKTLDFMPTIHVQSVAATVTGYHLSSNTCHKHFARVYESSG